MIKRAIFDLAQSTIGRQFLKYLAVGGGAFLADFMVLFSTTHFLGVHYLAGATAGFAVGLGVNYILCLTWIFDERALSNRAVEFTIFAVIGVLGLMLNDMLIWLLTEILGVHYLFSKILSAGAILFFNFGFRRRLLFSRHPTDQTGISTI